MSYGHGYDSDEARALAGSITAIMTGEAYLQSARTASAMGSFPGYRDSRATGFTRTLATDNVDSMQEVIRLHRQYCDRIENSMEFGFLKEEAAEVWNSAIRAGAKNGFRNAQVTVLAPTGTIGFLMDCDTTGIEPDIALVKYKLLAGGGMLKIVNQTVRPALEKLGYAPEQTEQILAHINEHDTIEDVPIPESQSVIKSGLENRTSADFRLRLQAVQGGTEPPLSGAFAHDGGVPAFSERCDFEDRQFAEWRDGRRDHEHVYRRLEAWAEGHRDLP